jgi:hypothetical protein
MAFVFRNLRFLYKVRTPQSVKLLDFLDVKYQFKA